MAPFDSSVRRTRSWQAAMIPISLMHELLEALAYLFDVLLMPFTTGSGSEPRKKWIKAVALIIAALGAICLGSLIVMDFLYL